MKGFVGPRMVKSESPAAVRLMMAVSAIAQQEPNTAFDVAIWCKTAERTEGFVSGVCWGSTGLPLMTCAGRVGGVCYGKALLFVATARAIAVIWFG